MNRKKGYLIRDNYTGLCLQADLRWGVNDAKIFSDHGAAAQALADARDSDYYRREHADAIQLVTLPEKKDVRQRTFHPRPLGLPRRPTGHN
jgi:hypothetical protein